MKLAATYYPGTKGKDSPVVVLLHGYKGSRKDFAELAPELQTSLGCAVLAPDLRGHGESKNGLTPEKMPPRQFAAMARRDMAAVMDFLRQENNGDSKAGKAPQANLNKLCLLGADMGASVALDFARLDWKRNPSIHRRLAKGRIHQGPDPSVSRAVLTRHSSPTSFGQQGCPGSALRLAGVRQRSAQAGGGCQSH